MLKCYIDVYQIDVKYIKVKVIIKSKYLKCIAPSFLPKRSPKLKLGFILAETCGVK